jgi:hypothetical protein
MCIHETYWPELRAYMKNPTGVPCVPYCSICCEELVLHSKEVPVVQNPRETQECSVEGEQGSASKEKDNCVMLFCGHLFGEKCILAHFESQRLQNFPHRSCPLCHQDVWFKDCKTITFYRFTNDESGRVPMTRLEGGILPRYCSACWLRARNQLMIKFMIGMNALFTQDMRLPHTDAERDLMNPILSDLISSHRSLLHRIGSRQEIWSYAGIADVDDSFVVNSSDEEHVTRFQEVLRNVLSLSVPELEADHERPESENGDWNDYLELD